jgi:3-oxoadipate enol-lactonase
MPRSSASGVDIYYEVAGEGPAMVLLHAIPFDNTLWLYQMAHFSTWFRVIAIDLRGFGRSSKVTAEYTLVDMARDVLGVLDVEHADRAVVMGCSVGSKIALQLGGMHPDRFSDDVQVGGNSGPQDFAHRVSGYASEQLPRYRAAHLNAGNRAGFSDEPVGGYLNTMFSERDPWHDPAAIVAVFRALSAADVRPYLDDYAPPTLIVNGEFDSARQRGEETARLIPGARHRVLAGAGHACMIEDPAGFDDLVSEFLADHQLMPEIRGSAAG